MALFQESGGTPEQRRAEADRLMDRLRDHIDEMEDKEKNFVMYRERGPIAPRQLFWLRDLAEKYDA